MYLGTYQAKLEAKNRVALPSKFRQAMGTELLLTNWFEHTIAIMNQHDFEENMKDVSDKSILLPEVRNLERFLYGGTAVVTCDAQGRLLIPERLKQHAKLKKDLVFVGVGRLVELWDIATWHEYAALTSLQARATAQAIAQKEDTKHE